MQKCFSAFPGGWPGLGLLLLRVLVAVSVIVQTIAVAAQLSVTGWIVAALVLSGSVCLVLGFVTPIAAALIGLASLGLTFSSYSVQNLDVLVLAVVVALLGPGAFSIDSRMFGRREIVIPTQRSSKQNAEGVR